MRTNSRENFSRWYLSEVVGELLDGSDIASIDYFQCGIESCRILKSHVFNIRPRLNILAFACIEQV